MNKKKKPYIYKDPVLPTDKELENWKPLSELIDSDTIIEKLESKKRKDIVTDLTWKNVVRFPTTTVFFNCTESASVEACILNYEYFCYRNKIYQVNENEKESPIDTGLTEDEVNEIL